MLRSFSKHFNETVFRGPDMEGTGGGAVDDTVLDTGGSDGAGTTDSNRGDDGSEGEGQEPLTVREQIKKSIAETSETPPEKTAKKKSGRFGDRAAKADAEPVVEKVEDKPAAPAIAAPTSLSPEAKAEWEKTPAAVQAAFVKREQDMAAGVQQLKERYNLIDQAIEPHTDALRQMNATPADAVNRMFLWFKALAGNPAQSFPALAESMGIDWAKLAAVRNQQAQAAAPAAGQEPAAGTASGGAPEIPEPVKNYVTGLETQINQLMQHVQQLGGRLAPMEQNIQTQNMARTEENLNLWSKDKAHFNEVRVDMANLIQSGIVPLKNGQVDLDTAYERAIYLNPEVRAKVLAEQQQANLQAQQESKEAATTANQAQVGRARKAAVSIPASTTPSGTSSLAKKKPGQKLGVRDSLKAAIAELRDQ